MKEIKLEEFNAEFVVSVKLIPKKITDITWFDGKKDHWWELKHKAGFYTHGLHPYSERYTEEELINGKCFISFFLSSKLSHPTHHYLLEKKYNSNNY